MTRIFVTGATGYIGGDAVHALAHAHPEYAVTCLVRDSDRAAAVAKAHASFTFVYGGLDDAGLVEEEARKADVVLSVPTPLPFTQVESTVLTNADD